MFHSETSSKILRWHTTSNPMATKISGDLPVHVQRVPNKIGKRTSILNRELKKFAALKSYSQYVKIKTKFLRKMAADASAAEETYSESNTENEIPISQKSNSQSVAMKTVLSSTMHQDKKKLAAGCSIVTKNVRKPTDDTPKKKRARARRNLTSLLNNVEITNCPGIMRTDESLENDDDSNNQVSSRKSLTKQSINQVTNIPAGDSGIDDDSQDNSSTNNREQDNVTELHNISGDKNRIEQELKKPCVAESPNKVTMRDEAMSDSAGAQETYNEGPVQKPTSSDELDEATGDEGGGEKIETQKGEGAKAEMEKDAKVEEEKEKIVKRAGAEGEKDKIEEEKEGKGAKGKIDAETETEDEEENQMILEDVKHEGVKGGIVEEKEDELETGKIDKGIVNEREKRKLEKESEDAKETEKMRRGTKNEKKKQELEKDTEAEEVEGQHEEKKEYETEDDALQLDATDDLAKKKCQPTITCTEILKSKYTIIREESEREEDDKEENTIDKCSRQNTPERRIENKLEESTEADAKSPESKRVNQLKRMNLLCSGSESDSSESDEIIQETINPLSQNISRLSQLISDVSDSEYQSDSSSFRITDSEDSVIARAPFSQDENVKNSRKSRFAAKSIKDQIEEQQIVALSLRVEEERANTLEEDTNGKIESSKTNCSGANGANMNDRSKKKHRERSDSWSQQYVFEKCSERSFDETEFLLSPENMQARDPLELSPNDEENMSRPIELSDFVARQGLIPTSKISTIIAKDLPTGSSGQGDDENIWLMEIPKSVIKDPELCGKTMLLENGKIRIGEVNYETILRPNKIVSCILRSKKKKARYKAVNIKPIFSINIRHERGEEKSCSATQAPLSPKFVPFPKNIKLRNPLTVESESRASSSTCTRRVTDKKKKRKEKTKKRKSVIWDPNYFILKPKKRKVNDVS